nr:MAG TPA: hypothetical protein [Caudoviricetes sp.]
MLAQDFCPLFLPFYMNARRRLDSVSYQGSFANGVVVV